MKLVSQATEKVVKLPIKTYQVHAIGVANLMYKISKMLAAIPVKAAV